MQCPFWKASPPPVHWGPSEISSPLGFPSLPTIFKSPQRFPAGLWGPCRKRPLASPWPAFSCVKQGSARLLACVAVTRTDEVWPCSLWHLTTECSRMAAMIIINKMSAPPPPDSIFLKSKTGPGAQTNQFIQQVLTEPFLCARHRPGCSDTSVTTGVPGIRAVAPTGGCDPWSSH